LENKIGKQTNNKVNINELTKIRGFFGKSE